MTAPATTPDLLATIATGCMVPPRTTPRAAALLEQETRIATAAHPQGRSQRIAGPPEATQPLGRSAEG